MSHIGPLLSAYTKFVQDVEALGIFKANRWDPVTPSPAADLRALETSLGVTIPADLAAFWGHDFDNVSLSHGDDVPWSLKGATTKR